MRTTHGWTTLDPSYMAVWEHMPSGLRCHLIVQDAAGNILAPSAWEPLEEFLPDTKEGHSLAHLNLTAGDAQVEIECGGDGDVAACRIWQVSGDHVTAHWEVEGLSDGWQVRREDGGVAIAPRDATLPVDVPNFLRTQREVARQSVPLGGGLLDEPLQAMEATLAANTITLPQTGEIITLSRHATEQRGEWLIPNWQTFLTALGIAYVDPELAISNCLTVLRHLSAGSFLGAEGTPSGVRRDISNPPVAAYAIWKIFQLTGNFDLLNTSYPILLRWHDWWWNNRDGNHNRLLGWASADETGMPGHPLFEDAVIDEKTGLMQLDDVGLCSLWALDAFMLMRMALQLNDLDQATHLELEMGNIADWMNLMLWDRNAAIYRDRDWNGRTASRQSATALLALAGRIPTRGNVERIIADHLDAEFNAPFLVPTVGSGDPAFGDQLAWRGRVSALLNTLICEGLRAFGEDQWAERITLSGLELIRRSWRDHHQIFDSYHAVTGAGNDIAQDTLAPAGLLFGMLGAVMLMDVEPWDGLRMGNVSGAEMTLFGFPLHGDTYDLASGPWGFTASCNGSPWLSVNRPVVIRNFLRTDREISFGAKTAEGGGVACFTFHGFTPGQSVSVKVNGIATPFTANDQGIVDAEINIQPPNTTSRPWGVM